MESLIQTVAIYAIPVIFAITLHEAAHGYAARHFGDATAWRLGRISLNPLRHVDLVGTIVLPLLILVGTKGNFVFGWAKPVPVNFSALRNPKRDMRWVAAAGPAANLAMTLAWALLAKLALLSTWEPAGFVAEVAIAGIIVNVLFMMFNLLPILPLDGGRVVCSLLPDRLAERFARMERWGLAILIGLLLLSQLGVNVLGWVLIPPMMAVLRLVAAVFQIPIY